MKVKFSKRFVMVLMSVFLVSAILTGVTVSLPPYNMWLDVNDDGVVDITDITGVIAGFGGSGEPVAKASLEYESGWINITDKCGEYFAVVHNLSSTDIMVDITGKISTTSEPHQRHLGLTSYTDSWSQDYGGVGSEFIYSLIQTSDGGYALAGYTDSYGDGYQAYLVKANALGVMQWNKTYGGVGSEMAYSLIQTSDGGYALAGQTSSYGDGYQAYLVKTTYDGSLQWTTYYGGAAFERAQSLVQTSDGGYALAGSTNSYGDGSQAYLVKANTIGTMQWNKTYGGGATEDALSLVQASDGGYALAGYTTSFGYGYQTYLMKTNSSGILIFERMAGGADSDYAESLVQASDGGYALAGYTTSYGDGYQAYLVKYDTWGNLQWNKTYGGVGNDYVHSLVNTVDGGYALAGYTNSYGDGYQAYLVKTDASGNKQWNQTYGDFSLERVYSLVQTVDGGYALAGYTNSYGDGYQAYLVKAESEFGLCRSHATDNAIWLYRGATDPYWNYVQVRVWKIKETP